MVAGVMIMKKFTTKTQLYIKSITVFAIILLIYLLISTVKYNFSELKGLLFFGLVAFITDAMPVSLPKGGFVAVTVAVIYACIVLFGPGIAAVVAIIGIFTSSLIHKKDNPWYKVMFNCAQFTLAAGISGLLYQFLGGQIWNISLYNIVPLTVVAITYFIINITAVAMILAFVQNISPWGIWITNFRWLAPNYITLTPIGFLMAYLYKSSGPLAIFIFIIPLLLARYIFKSYIDMREVYLNTLAALVEALDAKDSYTRGHSERVALYAADIARAMKLPEDQVEVIQHMGLLHDVGKIGVHDELLTRTGRLANYEFAHVQKHTEIGARIIDDINLGQAKDYILHHHEKYNGDGYPAKLRGGQIPLGARIITVADCFDAMTSNRPYREGLDLSQAILEMKRSSGTHFDPHIVEIFTKVLQNNNPALPNAVGKNTEALNIK